MDKDYQPPEPPPPPPPKQGLHGGIAFVLMFPVGLLAAVGLIYAAGTFAEQTLKLAALPTIACVVFALVLASMRKWGMAGLILGMSVPFGFIAMIVAICGK